MPTRRPQRIAKQLSQEVAMLLLSNAKDPILPTIEVTGARVSSDLQTAHIFWTIVEGSRDEAEAALARAASYMRREVAQRLNLRRAPQLRFHFDEGMQRADRLDNLFKELRESGQMGPKAEAEPDPDDEVGEA